MDEMSERLDDWWKLDDPPERDVAFRFAVMAKIERLRMLGECSQLVAMVSVVALVAWILAPALESIIRYADVAFMVTATTGLIVALTADSLVDSPERRP